MTVPKAKKAAPRPLPPRVPSTAPPAQAQAMSVPPSPAQPTANGKKKKKKKGKGKSVALDEDEDGEDDMPELEPMHPMLNGRTMSHTGLSPELESVHLSTTASLSASVAAATRLNPAEVAEAELLATADHLARSMELDSGDADVNNEYWASFPHNLRTFVRNTYSQLSAPGTEHDKTQAMYAIAQQLHSGAGLAAGVGGLSLTASATVKGITRSATTRYPPGSFPTSMPFDPAIFTDPAFTMAMEQAAAANGLPLHPPTSDRHSAQSPANVVLLDEYGSEDQDYPEDEYFSEDEIDDMEEDDIRATAAQFTLRYEEREESVTPDEDAEYPAANGRKKNKKKKKKKAGGQNATNYADYNGQTPAELPPVPAPAAPNAPSPAVSVAAAPGSNLPVSASHNRMPAPRPPPAANPPPSSRAAGKQPMSYNAPAPAANPPPPSRRAASKAPITSHAYQHNHAHHHPSPPSSNDSAPHKPRPPANGTAQTPPAKNSQIWSTSTTEERERIKEFWLGLGEDERRNLVKIEKEAVLRKMKEQQKHSCMCAVCGRKRSVLLVPSLCLFAFALTSPFLYVLIPTPTRLSPASAPASRNTTRPPQIPRCQRTLLG